MARAKISGYELSSKDARIVLGMVARGDRHHDIASWFGVNQGRIKDAQDGKYGTLEAAPAHELPPQGPPGIKGRRLRGSAGKTIVLMKDGKMQEALTALEQALTKYDANES